MRIAGLPSPIQPAQQAMLAAAAPKIAEAFREAVVPDEAAAASAVRHALAPPATSVQMLVALAAAEPAIDRRRKLAEGANRGLSALEALHAELLAGAPSIDRLRELAEWSDSFEPPEDPQLAVLARDIEVRVRVELAKHEWRA